MTTHDVSTLIQQHNAREAEIDGRLRSSLDMAYEWAAAARARLKSELFRAMAMAANDAERAQAAIPTAEPVPETSAKPCGCKDGPAAVNVVRLPPEGTIAVTRPA